MNTCRCRANATASRRCCALEVSELRDFPEEELAELAEIYRSKGLTAETAHRVAVELTAHDALAAHLDAELNLDPDDLVSPVHAAAASAAAFVVGALLPLIAILLPAPHWRVPVTFVAVLLALAVAGAVGARIGGSSRGPAVARIVIGGAVGLAVTYGIGQLVGAAIS